VKSPKPWRRGKKRLIHEKLFFYSGVSIKIVLVISIVNSLLSFTFVSCITVSTPPWNVSILSVSMLSMLLYSSIMISGRSGSI